MNDARRRLWVIILFVSASLMTTGCSVDFAGILAGEVDSQGEQPGGRPRSDVITIRFRNLTAREAVNVEFHATNSELAVVPDDLFTPANLINASVGVAGTGIVQPVNVDIIEYRCTDTLTIGTAGGEFLDNESGEFRGRGAPRWLQEGPLALCGSVVTFEFLGDGGSFMTVVSVQH